MFDLAEKGISISTVTFLEWNFYQGSSGPVSLATFSSGSLLINPSYSGRITRTSSLTASLNLTQPTEADEGNYTCSVVHGPPQPTLLTDFILTVLDPPRPDNLSISLYYDMEQGNLNCSGPSSLGDAKLAIARNDTSSILAEDNKTTLIVPFNQISMAVPCSCFLTGQAANCITVMTNGSVIVPAPNTTGCNCTCICDCPCHCPTVFGLVITLAVVTAALLVCIIVIRCCQGGKWELGNGDRKLTMKEWVTIILMVVTVAFIIAVGVYTLSSERKCNGAECCGKSCCADACCAHACCPNTCCQDAYKASIAFVVIGSAEVITAIIVLMLSLCCFSKRPPNTLESTMGGAEVDMKPTKPSAPRSTLGSNGNSNTTSEPSPGRRLSPLSPTEKTGNVTETQPGREKTKKKKKSKKDQPELTEERPLPTPKQDEKSSQNTT